MGRAFKIRTDHAPLTWLRHTPDPVGQQARWLEIMEEFDFQVEHRPGVRHGNADALSRRPCHVKSCACRQKETTKSVVDAGYIQAVTSVLSTRLKDCRAPTFVPVGTVVSQVTSSLCGDDANTHFWSTEGVRTAQEED